MLYLGQEPPRQPTAEECDARAYVEEFGAFATWWPQMGGYSSHAWVAPAPGSLATEIDGKRTIVPSSCFEVVIYHDFEFPIPEDGHRSHIPPIAFHGCDPQQFIEIGNAIIDMHKKKREMNS